MDRDQSFLLCFIRFWGIIHVGTRRNTGYLKSVLFLHGYTMLKIVFVSHMCFFYSANEQRSGLMASRRNLQKPPYLRGLFVLRHDLIRTFRHQNDHKWYWPTPHHSSGVSIENIVKVMLHKCSEVTGRLSHEY